jgi:hypothetical protein
MNDGLREYGDYMKSKGLGQITGDKDIGIGGMTDVAKQYGNQISSLLNEGVQGIGIEAGAKFLNQTVLKPAGDYLTPSDSQLAGRQLGEIAGKGMKTQEVADRVASQQQEVSESLDAAKTDVSTLQEQMVRPELFQGTADETGTVALSGRELTTGELRVSRNFATAGAEETEGMVARGVPTAFTQADQLGRVQLKPTQAPDEIEMKPLSGSQDPTEPTTGESVLETHDDAMNVHRPLGQQAPNEAELNEAKASVTNLEQQQKDLAGTDIEATADKEIGDELGTGLVSGISDAVGVGLGVLGGALDVAMPLAGLGLGIFGLFEAGKDADQEKQQRNQEEKEANTIQTNANFASSMTNTQPQFGKLAMSSDLDTSKFGSSAYSHF